MNPNKNLEFLKYISLRASALNPELESVFCKVTLSLWRNQIGILLPNADHCVFRKIK